MAAWITLPQNNVVAGQTGHLSDHDDVSSALGTLWGAAHQSTYNVCAPPYNADPTGTNDSTAAINLAISTAAASGAGVVYLPAGSYKTTAALTLASHVALVGAGSGVSVINQSSTTANGVSGVDLTNITISGLSINGPGSGTGIGVNMTVSSNPNVTFALLTDVRVATFGSHGLFIQSPVACQFSRINVTSNGADAWHIFGSGTSCYWSACYALNNLSGIGYHLIGLSYSNLAGCAADGNVDGYSLSSCTSVALTGCGTESNTTDGYILSGGSGNSLTSCFVFANNHYGVHVTSGEVNASIIGFVEHGPTGSAVACIITDTGTSAVLINRNGVTADSYAASTIYQVTPTAPVLTPTFASGTAAQLSDKTRDYMVYFTVGTAGSAFSVLIGPTSTPTTTIVSSNTPNAGESFGFRLPAGWFVKWAGTSTTLANQSAVGC